MNISLFSLPLNTKISVDAGGHKSVRLGRTCVEALRTGVRTSEMVQYPLGYEYFTVFSSLHRQVSTTISIHSGGRTGVRLVRTCVGALRTAVKTSETVQYSLSYEYFTIFTTFEYKNFCRCRWPQLCMSWTNVCGRAYVFTCVQTVCGPLISDKHMRRVPATQTMKYTRYV
jgi:hypothetical protein